MAPSPSSEYWKGRLQNLERTFAEPVFANASVDEVRQYRGLMESYFLNFATAHAEAMNVRADADATAETEANYREVEAIYVRLGAAITQRLNVMDQQATRGAGAAMRPPAEIAAEVGTFNGEANEWTSFFARYTRLVHANMRLDNLEKLSLLCSLVQGPARDLVRRRDTDISAYDSAWQRLCALYQDTHALRRMYFGRLEAIPRLNEPSAAGLQQLLDQISAIMDRLRELGVNVNAAPQMFLYALEQRMDATTECIWHARRGQNVPTYQNLREFLAMRIQELANAQSRAPRAGAERAERPAAAVQPPGNPPNIAIGRNQRRARTPATRKVCIRCSVGHRLIRCPQFLHMTPPERRMRVRDWRLCEHCLVPTHTTQMCRAGNCRNCNGTRHNSLLCPEVEKREALQQANRRAEAQARAEERASASASASDSPSQKSSTSAKASNAKRERIAKLPRTVEPTRPLQGVAQIELGRSPSPLSDWVEKQQLNPITAPYMPPMKNKADINEDTSRPQPPQSPVDETDHQMIDVNGGIGSDILTQALQSAIQPNANESASSSSQMASLIDGLFQCVESGQQAGSVTADTHHAGEPNAHTVGASDVPTPSVSLPSNYCAPTAEPPVQLMDIEHQIDAVEPSDLGDEMEKMILTGEQDAQLSDEETAHSEMSTESTGSGSEAANANEPSSSTLQAAVEGENTHRHRSHKKKKAKKAKKNKKSPRKH